MTWTTRPRSDLAGLGAITRGDGPLVVLIHGVGLRAEAWNAQIDALALDHRVVAVDMPGHGHSPALPDTPCLADFTDAIARVIDAPAVVIGHSMGTMIALDLATRHADKVLGVAALNAIFERSDAAAEAVQSRAAALDPAQIADPSAPLQRWFGAGDSPERTACHDWLTSCDPKGYKTAYTVFAHENGPSRNALQKLHCPALFLTGADEPNSTPAMSQAMATLAPQGRAEIIPNAAHMLPMTHPNAVNDALRAFLAPITGA